MSHEERSVEPTSHREMQRRWEILRNIMRERRLDGVICQSANNMTGTAGYLRWMSGYSASGSYSVAALLPKDGPLVMIRHGGFSAVTQPSPEKVELGFGRVLHAPSFPAIEYCGTYDADVAAEEISRQGYSRMGILAPSSWYHGFGSRLATALGSGVELVDITEEVDSHKGSKSEEEIELIRQAAWLQDETLRRLAAFIKPGLRDFEITAYAQYVGQQLGSETGFFLGSSFRFGDGSLPLRHRSEQGRVVQEGDLLYLLLENSGPGGMFTHIGRFFSLGPPPAELEDTFQKVLEARTFNLSQMVQGRSCADIFAEYNDYMQQHDYPIERRLHAHGQGLDVVERPLIRSDETMALSGNLNLGVHPFIFDQSKFVTCCDNYLLRTSGEMTRLHETPEAILTIA